MPLLDSRGRVFGRWNVIDACVTIFFLLLIPAGLVIYRVFRVPAPIIVSVAPARQTPGAGRRIRVKGRDFRPFLRAYVNKTGTPFTLTNRAVDLSEGSVLVETPETIEIALPPLQSATYDLYLFDELQQVAERPAAFVIGASADATVEATVRFTVLTDFASLVKPGDKDSELGDSASEAAGHASLKDIVLVANQPMTLDMQFPTTVGRAQREAPDGVDRTLVMHTAGRALDATVLIPAERAPNGTWLYKGQAVRAGDGLSFQTPRYAMYGVILRVDERREAK